MILSLHNLSAVTVDFTLLSGSIHPHAGAFRSPSIVY